MHDQAGTEKQMAEWVETASDEAPDAERRPYREPEVRDLGRLTELTRNNQSGTPGDTVGGSTFV